jgi:hypothetical protein
MDQREKRMAMSRALRRVGVAGMVAIGSLVVLSDPAMAAPPGNDDVTGATEITAVPFSDVVDTTEATTTAEEATWNDFCGAPSMDHAVWYRASADADGTITIDATGSDYSAGILVLQGTPGAFTPVACQPGSITGPVSQGTEYYLMIFGDDGSDTGGTLRLDVRRPVDAPQIDLRIDARGTVDKQGVATVSGTVACTTPDGAGQLEYLYGQLRQPVGRVTINGFGEAGRFVPCDGTPYPWSSQMFPSNGRFGGGKADVTMVAGACGTDQCNEATAQRTIQLNRKG